MMPKKAITKGDVYFCHSRECRRAVEDGLRRAQEQGIPSATLIEVASDLVGLTDVAELIGVSRQNMRKLMLTHPGSFQAPVHEGSASIWHLADLLTCLQAKGSYSLTEALFATELT